MVIDCPIGKLDCLIGNDGSVGWDQIVVQLAADESGGGHIYGCDL